MKKIQLSLVVFVFAHTIYCQQFHAFLFCKTSDKKIGTSVRWNYANMHEELQLIASAIGYSYVEHPVTGVNFNVHNVMDIIQNADIKSNDIVIIYFSSHGAKSKYDSNIFPQIDIPDSLVSAYKEHKLLAEKKPKFILTAIEACSGYQNITPQEAFVFEQSNENPSIESLSMGQVENIKKLFSSSCEIIITAGNPGKNTWATSQGSMFTNCFLRAMNECFNSSKSDNVTWDHLLNQAKQYTYDMTSTTSIQYYPVWQKKDCNSFIAQSVDTTKVIQRNVSLQIETRKRRRIRNPYDINLEVINNSGFKIDSVEYFLHKTMKHPILTIDNENKNFFLTLAVWGSFPIKAKVFFADGKTIDLYKNFALKEDNE